MLRGKFGQYLGEHSILLPYPCIYGLEDLAEKNYEPCYLPFFQNNRISKR